MIERKISKKLIELSRLYPVVTITGPRQSGKTTVCQMVFPDHRYVSLEPLDVRRYAREDPRGFLAEHGDGVVLDEVQHAPGLLSYLQVEVDARPAPGRFVLTGSQHFGLTASISQSLAGRTGILYLLPLDWDEVRRFDDPDTDLLDALWKGGYPRIHHRGIPADVWLADYTATYVQRDVRQVLNVTDLEAFTTFLRLAAGRTAQVLNLSALGADAGVTHNTARSWTSVLETGFIAQRLPPWSRNVKKQLTRSPKLHFLDSGLACHLLGIRSPEELRHHPLRGAIFESWVCSEVRKARANRGLSDGLCFFRDHKGLEVDLVIEEGRRVILTECKSGATVAGDFFANLARLTSLVEATTDVEAIERRVVYGGEAPQQRREAKVVPWHGIQDEPWA